ncbi:MAG: ferredoxin [bacterium]|nr:ferredoxin [bacterium]
MAIKKVWIIEGCISCGVCEATAPDVFEVPDEAIVLKGMNYEEYEEDIVEAVENCPVEVIQTNDTHPDGPEGEVNEDGVVAVS